MRYLTVLFCAVLSACSLYQPDLHQGRLIGDKEIKKLKVGMTRQSVLYAIGQPTIDPFLTPDRLVYNYGQLDGDKLDQSIKFKNLELTFKDNKLVNIKKNY